MSVTVGQMLAHPWGGVEPLSMGWCRLWHRLNGVSWVEGYNGAHPSNPARWVATCTAVRVSWKLEDGCHHCEYTVSCHLHWLGHHSKHNLKVKETWGRAREEANLPSVITKSWQTGFKSQSFGGCFSFFSEALSIWGVIFSCDVAYIWNCSLRIFKSLWFVWLRQYEA